METLIGLLFLLLPVIFKVIEKKLQQSGKIEQAGKMRELAEMFNEDETVTEIEEESEEKTFEIFVQPQKVVHTQPVQYVPKSRTAAKSLMPKNHKKSAPILLEEETKRKKEKIDPKKLIVYSEIMKPKYTE